MSYRALLMTATLAALCGGLAHAETIATERGLAVREPSGPAPTRGMTMHQVVDRFGEPVTKVPAVGKPPISRWEYPGFIVFFEYDHVVHTVASS